MPSIARSRTVAISFAIAAAAALPAGAASAQNSSLDNLTASQTFPAWQSTVKYQMPASGKPQFYGNYARATASVRYDAATQSYIVRDTGNSSKTLTFAPADKVVADSNATFTVYQKVSGNTTDRLRLLNPGAGNPLIALTYTSYGAWRQTTPGAGWNGAAAVSDTYFVFGIKTAAANVPKSGSASYGTVLDGTFVNKDAVYAVGGTGTFTANFGAGTISYSATPVGTTAGGPNLNFGLVGGTGTIAFANSSFNGNATAGLNPTYQMSLAGYFFGPTANEVGATFRLNGGGGSGHGAMVGKQ